MNLITRMIKTTSLVVLIGIVEVLKVGQQIIDTNRFQYPNGAIWIYGVIFLLYFLSCWPLSILAKFLEKRWSKNMKQFDKVVLSAKDVIKKLSRT